MNNNIQKLIQQFEIIKQSGLHKSLRQGNTGIGYTLEFLLGKEEDSSFNPDYYGIEIKSKLGYSKCPITLFSLVPKSSYNETIKKIVELYGYPDKDFSEYKVLRAHAQANQIKPIQSKYLFNLIVDWNDRRVRLVISNKSKGILNDKLFWDFDELKERLYTKLQYMALIVGYPYRFKSGVYYKYINIKIYKLKDFYTFVKLIETGVISVIFNIGIYKKGDKLGQLYDHGTGFKIFESNVDKLFDKIYPK